MRNTGWLVILAIVLGCAVAFALLDGSGWISHKQENRVAISGNWMTGEVRDCSATPNTRGEIYLLNCLNDGEGDEALVTVHSFPVRYWGKTVRPDLYSEPNVSWKWHCRRMAESVTCRSVN
jgi:hypothetical protein